MSHCKQGSVRFLALLPSVFLLLAIPALALSSPETVWDLSVGQRTDRLQWSIAGSPEGTGPDVLSELTWRDLRIFQLKARVATVLEERTYFRFSGGYGIVDSGHNRDSDYRGDGRTLEFSRSENNASDGDVWDASLGAGWQFRPDKGRLRISPLFGYSWHAQNLKMTDGFQVIPPTGAFSGLDSRYDSLWHGPWVGVDLELASNARWSWLATAEYHWVKYTGRGNWNLRPDFAHPVSFKHDAFGTGMILSLGGRYALDGAWTLGISFDYQDWSTSTGNDRTHFSNGSFSDTQFNGAAWRSYAGSVTMGYRW